MEIDHTKEVLSPLVYWSSIHPVPLAVVMFDSSPYPPITMIDHNLAFQVKHSHVSVHRVPGLGEVGVDLGQELVGLRCFGHREAGRGMQMVTLDPSL